MLGLSPSLTTPFRSYHRILHTQVHFHSSVPYSEKTTIKEALTHHLAISPCTLRPTSCHLHDQTHTDASGPTNLSLPAALALQALSALLAADASDQGSLGGHFVPDLKRVRTRLIVGPEAGKSSVVPVAATVEVSPWERATVQDAFVRRHRARNGLPREGGG